MRDVSAHDIEMLKTVALRLLWDIPGVQVGDARHNVSNQPSTMGGRPAHQRREPGAVIAVMGWASSLHAQRQDVVVRDLDNSEAPLEKFAATQRSRAARAARMGLTEPVPSWRKDNPDADTGIHHMRASSAGLNILHQREGVWNYVTSDLRRAVDEKLTNCYDHQQKHEVAGTRIDLRYDIGRVMVSGRVVYVPARFPDTIMSAASTLRIGDLVHVHPLLDGRRIDRAEMDPFDDQRTRFIMRGDEVRVGDLVPEGY